MWRRTGLAVRREAAGARVLCFGSSLTSMGVAPRVLEERLGMPAYNFATSRRATLFRLHLCSVTPSRPARTPRPWSSTSPGRPSTRPITSTSACSRRWPRSASASSWRSRARPGLPGTARPPPVPAVIPLPGRDPLEDRRRVPPRGGTGKPRRHHLCSQRQREPRRRACDAPGPDCARRGRGRGDPPDRVEVRPGVGAVHPQVPRPGGSRDIPVFWLIPPIAPPKPSRAATTWAWRRLTRDSSMRL